MLAQWVAATQIVIPDVFLQCCISAMYMLAFYGFLRIGEITKRPGGHVEDLIQLQDLKFFHLDKENVPWNFPYVITNINMAIGHSFWKLPQSLVIVLYLS